MGLSSAKRQQLSYSYCSTSGCSRHLWEANAVSRLWHGTVESCVAKEDSMKEREAEDRNWRKYGIKVYIYHTEHDVAR